jgi:transcriptional regulator with XRE-family HTH domain
MKHAPGPPLKVNSRMIHRIKQLRAQGKTQEEIAAEVGLAQGSVSIVLRAQGLGGPLKKIRRRR